MDERDDRLYKIRHSLAHVLAQAVLEMRPGSKLAFGPPVDNGFYYDFDLSESLSSDDFPEIEERMRCIIAQRQEFQNSIVPIDEAISQFEKSGEVYKKEYALELQSKGESELSFYKNGSFVDMCRGPHVEHTAQLRKDCFCLDSLAGAYWRGMKLNLNLLGYTDLHFPIKKS